VRGDEPERLIQEIEEGMFFSEIAIRKADLPAGPGDVRSDQGKRSKHGRQVRGVVF